MADKPDTLATNIVFVDTCIFVSSNYSSTSYKTLIRLAKMGAVKLKITDITLKEIEREIAKKMDEAVKTLNSKTAKSTILRNFDEYAALTEKFGVRQSQTLSGELHSRVRKELTDAGVEVIDAEGMPAGPVFDAYFRAEPPFSTGDKKHEFPDAFVLAALENWCDQAGEEMYVISSDKPVVSACGTSDYLHPVESLDDFIDLALREDESVEKALEFLQEHPTRIEKAVARAIEDQYIYLEDEDGDGEGTVNHISVSVEDVVGVMSTVEIVVGCSANVDMSISASFSDPNMTVYEDGESIVLGNVSRELERNLDVSAEVTIRWKDHSDYEVTKVLINGGDSISVYVDEDARTHWK